MMLLVALSAKTTHSDTGSIANEKMSLRKKMSMMLSVKTMAKHKLNKSSNLLQERLEV